MIGQDEWVAQSGSDMPPNAQNTPRADPGVFGDMGEMGELGDLGTERSDEEHQPRRFPYQLVGAIAGAMVALVGTTAIGYALGRRQRVSAFSFYAPMMGKAGLGLALGVGTFAARKFLETKISTMFSKPEVV